MIDIVIACILCWLRVTGMHNSALKDTAHIFMGYLGRRIYEDSRLEPWYLTARSWVFAILCVVEVGCVFYYGLH